jgi:subtilisin-like proprotein convertase family protein
MRSRRLILIALFLLCAAGVWLLRHEAARRAADAKAATAAAAAATPGTLTVTAPLTDPALVSAAEAKTNPLAYRLSNTTRPIGQLVGDRNAILLENALIDSSLPVNFSFPPQLREAGDPGAYIVQSRGPINAAFRALLARAGAQIVSYIPNDAYLVKISAGGANALAGMPPVQSVLRWEPYYKIQSALLGAAVHNQLVGAPLNLGLFADNAAQTIQQIEQLGGRILSRDMSPFGPVVRVQPPADWTTLAALSGVLIVEPYHPRVHANDLSRVSTGVSVDTLVPTNYMLLTGSNVTVVVADSGIDATHPGFTTGGSLSAPGGAPVRVQGYTTNDLVDTDGHGTFVAGQIAGNGDMSTSPVNVGAVLQADNYGSVSNADFRGKAPLATLYAMNMNLPDQILQEEAAQVTNALIENDSWNYDGDNTYSLAAASYDAATRDALPGVTGSQPMLFVFSAGNAGGPGDDSDDPGGGYRDTIQSPATAKNVVSVGAIQEWRDITNQVTEADGSTNEPWLPETSTGYRVAGFSSRGNVGIGIEGAYGRFKPDVVAPGTFIVSTRSSQWDVQNYFYENPTNTQDVSPQAGIVVGPDSLSVKGFPFVPDNAISVNITVIPNGDSPDPFPLLPVYFALFGSPWPPSTFTTNNQVNIPSDGGLSIDDILNNQSVVGFNYGISNVLNQPISFDIKATITTTNGVGNGMLVLSNLDNTLGPYYRFETGTSMAAADVSGTLALMQDFFTNTLHILPSPALLKAMLINGARPTGVYDLQVNNSINFTGWGLVNLPNSLPTNGPASFNGTTPSPVYFQDQSPTNALATGDSHTFLVTVQTNTMELRVTLVWTDPPGNPAAAIKLVNNLELVVTNFDNPTNPVVYFGNDIPAGYIFNTPEGRTNTVVPDSINNVQNVIIPPYLGTNYSITVIGRGVNVNAVSAQTNSYNNASPSAVFAPNVVQDYALVVSSTDGGVPGSFTVADKGIVSNPTGDQDITFVTTTNQPYLDQFVGANPPLLGTNSTPVGTNGAVVLGMTNQWHFYVVTNNGVVSSNGTTIAAPYAGFVTFLPPELSVPRMGVFAGTAANATRPEADIDLYVTTDSNLLILSPLTVSNCLGGALTPGSVFNGVSLTRGGTEYVVDTNSTPGEVYYIGVQSQDQMGSEYDFFPVFSNIPFSSLDNNGDETVNGVPVPVNIPDGSPADPGVNFVLGLAIYPIEVANITASVGITHQNFGDLYGTLTHSGSASGTEAEDVLNNHDGLGSVTNLVLVYDDSGTNTAALPSDGPGSLQTFFGQDGSGVWRLTEADTALTQTGSVQSFTMFIKRQIPLGNGSGVTNSLAPQTWFYDYVDVPPGATNLIISVTNLMLGGLQPLDVFVKLGAQPTTNDYDKMAVVPTLPLPHPGISISIGPTDVPPLQPGRYWIGVFNTDPNLGDPPQTFSLFATILPANPTGTAMDFASTNSTPLLDDAVTNADIYVATNLPVVSVNVGIRVEDSRISDLVFYLISPSGTRVDLMQNRGGADTNGAGATVVVTNVTLIPTNITVLVTNVTVYSNNLEGLTAADYLAGATVGGWTVTTNQVSLLTDPASAYQGSNFLALASGGISYTLPAPVTGGVYTLTFAYRGPGIAGWWRGENNLVDNIYGNNGAPQNITYSAGEVGQAFNFNGSSSSIQVPASSPLNVGLNDGFTLDTWINPATVSPFIMNLIEWNNNSGSSGIGTHLEIGADGVGVIHLNIIDTTGAGHVLDSAAGIVTVANFQHIAATYNKLTGLAVLYRNGAVVASANLGTGFVIKTSYPLYFGERPSGAFGPAYYNGLMDEVSIYNRPLSDSEVNAIYNAGTAGKFDPAVFNTSPAQSLAEAQISINGSNTPAFYGNNTNWQIYTASGAVATNGTVLAIAGLEPGMLLDSLLLTNINITTNIVTFYLTVTNVVTNSLYLTFTENTNLATTPIKFAIPPFVPPITTPTILFTNGFEGLPPSDYVTNQIVSGWTVLSNQVSVVADPTNAYDGSNFLALAGGSIFTNLPTVLGQNYTLTFAYRGPGIAAWWRGESNGVDSINGNTAAVTGSGVVYTNGEVGMAFDYPTAKNGQITAPASPSLAVSNITLEAWIYPTLLSAARPVIIYGGAGQTNNIQLWINTTNTTIATSVSAGALHALIRDAGGVSVLEVDDPNPVVQASQWNHVVFSANLTTGIGVLYCNGSPVMTNTTPTPITCMSFENVNLGYMSPTALGEPLAGREFLGKLDEVSIYNRPISDSEVKAIYNAGTAGKFDPAVFTNSPAQSLAEARVNLGNVAPATILGNNTTWQTETISFTATQAQTPLQIAGIEPGMLLDDFILTQEPGDLYYFPEQSLDILAGEGAAGDWQLEIQDDRAGAFDTNGPPVLLGWDLQFVFDNTNQVPTVVSGGIGQSNQFVPPGDIAWYQVKVPSSASYATNLLLFASAPLNVWFDTNSPSTTNILLLSGTSGSVTLSTTNAPYQQSPPAIYAGQTYYLGVQNTNAVTVNYGIQVNFNVAGQGGSLALSGVAASSGGTTLKWTASVNAQFQVQWTDDFTQPWNTDTNIITSSDGNFIFTDTAPPGQMRFYRLVQISSGQGGPLGTSP